MNNANCYALEAKARYIYDSDEEEEYEFHGANIVRTQKSMSMMSAKQSKLSRQVDMKKSNSFLLSNKPVQSSKPPQESKDKSKTSKTSKKCMNVTEVRKKPGINSKNSMTKTSVSIGNVSTKSVKTHSKNRSISRDYIILDSEIYQCDNIEEINEKLICGNSPLYSHERFIKATLKNQERLETYLLSFVERLRYEKRCRVAVQLMSQQQKKKLYLLLKSETSINTRARTQESFSIEGLIRQAYNKIEQKTSETIIQSPKNEQEIRKWKNAKLHQLMEIHTCFKESEDSGGSDCDTSFKVELKENRGDWQGMRQAKEENGIVKGHLVEEKYPTIIKASQMDTVQIGNHLADDHMLSKAGILKFLHNLWDFLVDSQLIGSFISKLQHSYGLSRQEKVRLMGEGEQSYSHALLLKRENSPILPNEIFISFCKCKSGSSSLMSEQQQKAEIIFHKGIFDALNFQLHRFRPDFPLGCYHPFERNPSNSAYLIDQENAMVVWEDCIDRIIRYESVAMGSLSSIDSQEMEKLVKAHDENSFKQMIQLQSQANEWQRIKPLTDRCINQQLCKIIESQLIKQLLDQLPNF